MGSLADLIVAPATDAQAIVASEYPLGSYVGVNVDGLDPLQLAALHSLLTNKDLRQLLEEYQPIAAGSISGPWLIKFPGDLIEMLVSIAPQDQASEAVKWASTDELQAEGCSDQDAERFIAQLVHFARTAAFEEKELYLCVYD
jgi:hypothetical protein